MSKAVGNGALETLAKAIGSDKISENVADIQGIMGVTYGDGGDAVHLVEKSGSDYDSPALIEIHHQVSDLQTPEKTAGLMYNPETGKLYIPCGNGITVNRATGMLEVPIGGHLRYTDSGIDVPDADETTAGVVKLTHEVSNRDDGEWAVTADGVHAYCPAKGMAAEMPASGDYLTSTIFDRYGNGCLALTKNRQLCVTGTMIFTADVPINVDINTLAFDNKLGVDIPCFAFWGRGSDPQVNKYCTHITRAGYINDVGALSTESTLTIILTAGIYPIFANKE